MESNTKMGRSLRYLAPIAILLLVLLLGFHRLVASPGSLIVDPQRPSVDHADRSHSRSLGNDVTSVFLPRFLYIVKQVRENGRRPSWDATGFGGRPLVGNPQAGVFYPPVWIAWWSGHPASLGWLTVAHLFWGGLGVYVLGRSLGLGQFAAVVAGVCFEASPFLIAHTFEGHYPHIWSVSWYPWAFWSLGLLRRPRHRLGIWILPGVLALAFLAGHPQEWYYLVVALTLFVIGHGLRDAAAGSPSKGFGHMALWGGLLTVSLGFCAVELLPDLAVKPWLLKRGAIALGQVNRYQLHGENLLQLLSPFALGRPEAYAGHDNYWETVLSMGLAPLSLALIGVAGYRDRGLVFRWTMLVLIAVAFAAGRKAGVYSLAYAVLPGMERFRVPSRSLFLASVGASVLAGAGVQAMLDWRNHADGRTVRAWLRVGLLALGLGAVVVGVTKTSRPVMNHSTAGASSKFRKPALTDDRIAMASLAAMTGVVSLGRSTRRGTLALGLSAIALAELTFYTQSLLVCAPFEMFVGPTRLTRHLADHKDEHSGPVRVASVGTLYPDLGAAAGAVEKTNVNDIFQIQHAADLYERLYPVLEPATIWRGGERAMDTAIEQHDGRIAQAVMDLMSVRYLVADRPRPLNSMEIMREDESVSLWRNRSAMPRAYVVPRAIIETPLEGESVARRLRDLDPKAGVVMSTDPLADSGKVRQPFTPAEWIGRDPDEVTIRIETAAPGLLIVGNTWMPGWSAEVDSVSAPVLRGNHWQQVVPIRRAGRHQVILRYQPPGHTTGLTIASVTLAGWAGFGLILLVRLAWRPCWIGLSLVKPSLSACG